MVSGSRSKARGNGIGQFFRRLKGKLEASTAVIALKSKRRKDSSDDFEVALDLFFSDPQSAPNQLSPGVRNGNPSRSAGTNRTSKKRSAGQPAPKQKSKDSARRLAHKKKDCAACMDKFMKHDLAHLPCGHEYCRECISKLFADAIVDQSRFPPRCCKATIKIKHVHTFLTSNVVAELKERKEELKTVHKTYCRKPDCGKFIPRSSINNDVGYCNNCRTSTCCLCKGVPHSGDCPQDLALQSVLQTAKTKGWKRCQNCKQIVERSEGCPHITCRCGAHFCYTCGNTWHDGACPK